MTSHFNIQLTIQQVEVKDQPTTVYRRGVTSEEEEPRGRRTVTEVASIKIVASSEEEAFGKTARLLDTLRPEPPHVHRASCDDASGNHLCGEH